MKERAGRLQVEEVSEVENRSASGLPLAWVGAGSRVMVVRTRRQQKVF